MDAELKFMNLDQTFFHAIIVSCFKFSSQPNSRYYSVVQSVSDDQ